MTRRRSEDLTPPLMLGIETADGSQSCPSQGIILDGRVVPRPKLPTSTRLIQDTKVLASLPQMGHETLKATPAPRLPAELAEALVAVALWGSVPLSLYRHVSKEHPLQNHSHPVVLLRVCSQEPQYKMLLVLQVYSSK